MPTLAKKKPARDAFWCPRELGCAKLVAKVRAKLAEEKGVSRVSMGDAIKAALVDWLEKRGGA